MKVVINRCCGGYKLSRKAYEELGLAWDGGLAYDSNRADPELVRVVEKLGKAAGGRNAELCVVEIPDGIVYEIDSFDGKEAVFDAGGWSNSWWG